MDDLQGGIQLAFAVLPSSAALIQPAEGSFDDPTLGQHHAVLGQRRERMQFIALDDLDGGFQAELYAIGEGLATVSSIHQHAFDAPEIRLAAVEGLQGTAPVRSLCGGYGDGMGQALRVNGDMTFDAGDLLARVIALLFGTVAVLYALRINDQEAGRAVAPLFLAGLANGFFKARSRTPTPSRSGSLHLAK